MVTVSWGINYHREMERADDEDGGSEKFEDMKFNGGLCIPGKIWHRLYKYVTSNQSWRSYFIK